MCDRMSVYSSIQGEQEEDSEMGGKVIRNLEEQHTKELREGGKDGMRWKCSEGGPWEPRGLSILRRM